jgi:large subunit ribosomal protein L13
MKTTIPSVREEEAAWYVIDAENQVLGQIATKASIILRGKNKPQYTPNLDFGDNVIVINADKLSIEPRKLANKKFYSHSGFPGGLKISSYSDKLEKPENVVYDAVKGMLPKNKLSAAQIKKLRVFSGSEHTFQAQKPQTIKLERIKQQ